MGLYGERAGAIHFVCKNKETAEKVHINLNQILRFYLKLN